MPERIQLKRTKGWRMPAGVVHVARPSRWGNPWAIRQNSSGVWYCDGPGISTHPAAGMCGNEEGARLMAVRLHRDKCERGEYDLEQLRGKNVACFCSLDQACHGDNYLDFANR